MSSEPGWVPPVGKTCHTGGTWGGVDLPPTWLLWFYEGAGEQSAPVGFSVRKLFPGISPQETSNGNLWQESTPYTLYWACVTSLTLPSPPPPGGEVRRPHCTQLHIDADNGTGTIQPQVRLHTPGNVPVFVSAPYIRFPSLSLAKFRPPLCWNKWHSEILILHKSVLWLE